VIGQKESTNHHQLSKKWIVQRFFYLNKLSVWNKKQVKINYFHAGKLYCKLHVSNHSVTKQMHEQLWGIISHNVLETISENSQAP